MVRAEESRGRRAPLWAYWPLMIVAVVGFGAIGLASARIIHAAPRAAPLAAGVEGSGHCRSDGR